MATKVNQKTKKKYSLPKKEKVKKHIGTGDGGVHSQKYLNRK